MSLLQLKSLEVHFPMPGRRRLHAVRSLDLSLARGEAVAIVGESGCGKSTVARAIARLLTPSGGQILFGGQDVLKTEPRRASTAYRSGVQMVFQDPFGSLNPAHTVLHHVVRPLRIHGKADRASAPARAVALLERVGLTPAADLAERYPHALSGGQRQRLAIARALAVEPALLVADEPTSMLDMSIRAGILELLRALCGEGDLALILITHDLGSARAVADRIAVMYGGQIVEQGPAEEVLAAPAHPYTQELVRAARREAEPDDPGEVGALDLTAPPAGCAYAARCPHAEDRCRAAPPPVVPRTDSHHIRCILPERSA